MSNWSHVAAVIKIDNLRFNPNVKPNFDELIGKEVNPDDDAEIWNDARKHPDKYLPMSNGGSLKKSIYEDSDINRKAAYTIRIFGVLRNHDDPDEIIKWFKNKMKIWKKKFKIRQMTVTVHDEQNGTRNYTPKL